MAVGILLLVEVACLRPRPGGIRHNALIDGSPPVEQRPLPVTVDRPPFPFSLSGSNEAACFGAPYDVFWELETGCAPKAELSCV